MELPNIAAYAYQDVHVWSALLTCLRPDIYAHFRNTIDTIMEKCIIDPRHTSRPTASEGASIIVGFVYCVCVSCTCQEVRGESLVWDSQWSYVSVPPNLWYTRERLKAR